MTKTHVDDVAVAYDAWAAVYDSDGNPLVALDDEIVPPLYARSAADKPPPHGGWRALDVGCGTGRHAAHLAAAGYDVTGVDASPGMLAIAKKRVPSARFSEHRDLTRLPFADKGSAPSSAPPSSDAARFDVVTCALVLEHVADLGPPIREMARVVRPGGLVIVSDIHAQMRAMTQANFTDPTTGDDVLPPSFPHEASDYADAARAAGLEVVALREVEGTAALVAKTARAKKYLGVRMLTVLVARRQQHGEST